jgi:hypothetical protein
LNSHGLDTTSKAIFQQISAVFRGIYHFAGPPWPETVYAARGDHLPQTLASDNQHLAEQVPHQGEINPTQAPNRSQSIVAPE